MMIVRALFSAVNASSGNQTEDKMDPFCRDLLVGPVLWATFSIPCACIGALASIWLLWLLLQRECKSLPLTTTTSSATSPSTSMSSNDLYVLHLAVMDVLYNLSVVPCVINVVAMRNEAMLRAMNFLYSFNMAGRPLFMACSCVNCYLAVVHPIAYVRVQSSNHRVVVVNAVCLLVWMLTTGYGLYFANGHDQLVSSSFLVLPYAVALPIIVLADGCILCTLRKPDPSGRSGVHPLKQRALQIVTNTVVMVMFSYFPPLLVFGLADVIPLEPQLKLCLVTMPFFSFSTFGSVILPLLHLRNMGHLSCLEGPWWCTCTNV